MKKLFTLLFLLTITSYSWSQDHTVNTVGVTFDPDSLTIFAGQTVQWVNTGGTHNVNGTQTAYPNNPESFDNGAASAGWTFDYTFNTTGLYDYHCDPHLGIGMTGKVRVLNTLYPIGLVTADSDANGQADSVDVACSLVGVVHGVDLDGNNGISFTIIDAAGDGIAVFNFNDVDDYVVTEGDEITVEGTISSFNGLAQIFADAIIVNSQGNAINTPLVVTTLDESTESQLIKMNNMTLVDPTQWDNAGSNNINITDGTNTFTMRLDSDVDLNDAPAPTGAFNITGIGGQFDQDSAWVEGYQILPRYVADLEEIVDPCGIGTLTGDSDLNGQADSIGAVCTVTGIVYGVDLDGNNGISFTIIDAAGDGINVFNFNDVDAYVVTEGDEVSVEGTIQSFNGLAQIFPTSITLNSQGNALVTPTVVTTLDESTESQLIKMNNMTLVDPTQWDNMGSNNIEITDGTNTFTMRLDSDVDLNDEPAPTGAFNITGIGGQFDQDSAWVEGYQILPRYVADLEAVSSGGPALLIIGIADPQPGNGAGSATAGAKTIQLYALEDIPDLSKYGVGVANNGGGTDGVEFTFPADAISAGTCITFTDSINESRFLEFYGVPADYLVPSGGSSAAGVNGDDAVELFEDGVVIDTYGDINVLGDGEVWDYTDGWAYRINGTGPDGGTFVPENWIYSGVDVLQSNTLMVNADFANPFPTCTYLFMVPDIEAMNDNATVPMDVASNIDILGNDIIPIGVNTLTITSGPVSGTAMVNGTVDILYTPAMGSCAPDSLTYEICDDNGCSTGTVNIGVFCDYPISLITADSDGDGAGDSLGVAVEVTAIVYGIDLQGTNDDVQFTIIDDTNNGIGVFGSNFPSYVVTEGDEVTIRGFVTEFRGLTQINPTSIDLNSTGNALVTPTDVTALDESTESQLVRIVNVSLVNAADWTSTGSFNVEVTDGTNTYDLRLDSDVNLASEAAPTGLFNITGIGGQFDFDAPYTEGYQLLPRYIEDLEEIIATNDLELGNKIQFMPNPTSDILNIRSEVQLDEIRISNMLGQQMTNFISPNLSETVNVNNWQSGIYVLTFISGDRIFTSQFVKQ